MPPPLSVIFFDFTSQTNTPPRSMVTSRKRPSGENSPDVGFLPRWYWKGFSPGDSAFHKNRASCCPPLAIVLPSGERAANRTTPMSWNVAMGFPAPASQSRTDPSRTLPGREDPRAFCCERRVGEGVVVPLKAEQLLAALRVHDDGSTVLGRYHHPASIGGETRGGDEVVPVYGIHGVVRHDTAQALGVPQPGRAVLTGGQDSRPVRRIRHGGDRLADALPVHGGRESCSRSPRSNPQGRGTPAGATTDPCGRSSRPAQSRDGAPLTPAQARVPAPRPSTPGSPALRISASSRARSAFFPCSLASTVCLSASWRWVRASCHIQPATVARIEAIPA